MVQTQFFDGALRADLHWHALLLDGVYTGFGSGERLAFHAASRLLDEEIGSLVRHIAALIDGHLRRAGYLDAEGRLDPAAGEELDTLGRCHAAAIQGLIPFGRRAGERTLLWGEAEDLAARATSRPRKRRCSEHAGYSLHAGIRISACNARRRERLRRPDRGACIAGIPWRTVLARYIARGPVAMDRLSLNSRGDVVYRFRKPWRTGKKAVVMDPLTFLSRLAALIPPPRMHVLSYYGVLGAAAARRDEIVPSVPRGAGAEAADRVPHSCRAGRGSGAKANAKVERFRPERLPWSDLLARVFLIDVLRCSCGGRRRVVAMVRDPASIHRILTHLGLPTGFPARGPPRAVPGRLPLVAHR